MITLSNRFIHTPLDSQYVLLASPYVSDAEYV